MEKVEAKSQGVVGLGASGMAGLQRGKHGGVSHLSRRSELKEGRDPRRGELREQTGLRRAGSRQGRRGGVAAREGERAGMEWRRFSSWWWLP
jgi:hypothetical protein